MTCRQLLLGLDVGTTTTKALLFDVRGHVTASASQAYRLETPRPGWVEQDPEALWRAVVHSIREVLAHIEPGDAVLALSLASQGGTTIPVDGDGRPICGAISWMDARGISEAAHVRSTLGSEYVRMTTGWPLGATLPLQHIAWLRGNRPIAFARTSRFQFVNDFITARLTHERAMDPSSATMTQLFNIAATAWDDRLLEAAGIETNSLSPVRPSGVPVAVMSPEASVETGLARDLIVVNGAHDQYCAAVGTGVTEPGKMLLSGGTAWVLLAVPCDLRSGLESGMAISCHAVPDRWGAIRSLGGVGTSLEWLIAQVYRHSEKEDPAALYATVNAGAARVPAGAGELLFLPMTGGHAASPSVRGGFVDMALSHRRDDMARAVMEGTVFELRWAIDEIRAKGVAIDDLTMVGGAAESPVWPRIVADITGLPVTVPAVRQAAARGAAILAGVGAGIFKDATTGFGAFRGSEVLVEPRHNLTDFYDRLFARYRVRYDAIHEIHL